MLFAIQWLPHIKLTANKSTDEKCQSNHFKTTVFQVLDSISLRETVAGEI